MSYHFKSVSFPHFLEPSNVLYSGPISGFSDEKRESPKSATSNLLVDENGQILINFSEEGGLTSLDGTIVNSEVTVNTVSADSKHYAFALYTAPSNFIREQSDDANVMDRRVFISAQFVDQSGQEVNILPTPVRILRPPVILVHGIWSSRETWITFSPLIDDRRFFIRSADYREFNDRRFGDGANKVYNMTRPLNFGH